MRAALLLSFLRSRSRRISDRALTIRSLSRAATCFVLSTLLWAGLPAQGLLAQGTAVPEGITEAEYRELTAQMEAQGQRLAVLRDRAHSDAERDRFADAALYHKGLTWALKYDTKFEPADLKLLRDSVVRGQNRIEALERGELPWGLRPGRVARGYVSAVDGTVQPFGLVIPPGQLGGRPARLDVVLHGSTKPVGLSELRFSSRFEETPGSPAVPDEPFIELHPLGRVENCYRWAGETDVFEAIEAVCRQYPIDRDRIVLRGMSMGASGTWHLGLKHPERFVALGPYCGYVDTHKFSETPLPNFIKVGPLPAYQEKGLHMLDSVDYAANAGVVPAIACMGEKDVFFDAHVIMGEAFRREGLQLVNLISPATGHMIDPVTQREQLKLIGAFADRGIDHLPRHLRFVTWTLKYNRCHWVELLELGEHYVRAEFEGRRLPDGLIEIYRTFNINRFALAPEVIAGAHPRVRLGELEIDLAMVPKGHRAILSRVENRWVLDSAEPSPSLLVKRPGLQGPIDDAFATPFLCVRGTGTPWNQAVHDWSLAALERFAYEWNRYMRGELRVCRDVEVTPDDLKRYNLILFGDPGSNVWIEKFLPDLPVKWTREAIVAGENSYKAEDHSPVLIHPNPQAPHRYVVINSGHTFHESEFAALNYLLFPRWGDWAVLKVGLDRDSKSPSQRVVEEVKEAGFFDERWQMPVVEPKLG